MNETTIGLKPEFPGKHTPHGVDDKCPDEPPVNPTDPERVKLWEQGIDLGEQQRLAFLRWCIWVERNQNICHRAYRIWQSIKTCHNTTQTS